MINGVQSLKASDEPSANSAWAGMLEAGVTHSAAAVLHLCLQWEYNSYSSSIFGSP